MNMSERYPDDEATPHGAYKPPRGTAAMDPATRQEVARKGGLGTLEKHGKQHFSELGRKGGQRVAQDREHMAEIGRKGGAAGAGRKRWSAGQD